MGDAAMERYAREEVEGKKRGRDRDGEERVLTKRGGEEVVLCARLSARANTNNQFD